MYLDQTDPEAEMSKGLIFTIASFQWPMSGSSMFARDSGEKQSSCNFVDYEKVGRQE